MNLLRLTFAWKFKRELPKDFWIKGVGFYLDGASTLNKINLADKAWDPKGMPWRKSEQGLNFGFNAKAIMKALLEVFSQFMVFIIDFKKVVIKE